MHKYLHNLLLTSTYKKKKRGGEGGGGSSTSLQICKTFHKHPLICFLSVQRMCTIIKPAQRASKNEKGEKEGRNFSTAPPPAVL